MIDSGVEKPISNLDRLDKNASPVKNLESAKPTPNFTPVQSDALAREDVDLIREKLSALASSDQPVRLNESHSVKDINFNIIGSPFDGLIEVKDNDNALKEVVQRVIDSLKSATPTVRDIALKINEIFPIDSRATTAVRNLREAEEPMFLGKYFQPGEGYPYSAVCEHKTLLAQAVASQYKLKPTILEFGFQGQIKSNRNDRKAGMHTALIYYDEDGQKRIADAHKGIDAPYEQYWQNFVDVQVFIEDHRVFDPVI